MKKYIFVFAAALAVCGGYAWLNLGKKTVPQTGQPPVTAANPAQDLALVKSYLKNLLEISRKPDFEPTTGVKPCPAAFSADSTYTPVDFSFLSRFIAMEPSEEGSYAGYPSQVIPGLTAEDRIFFRSPPLQVLHKNLFHGDPQEWDVSEMAEAVKKLKTAPYLLVFYPDAEDYMLPDVSDDNKTYKPGFFWGRQILVDALTGDVLCEAVFNTSAPLVYSDPVEIPANLRGGTLEESRKNLDREFADSFWKTVRANVEKMAKK